MLTAPPAELKPLTPGVQRLVLLLWIACLAFAIFAQAGATWRLWVFQTFTNPTFSSVGLFVPNAEVQEWRVLPFSPAAERQGLKGGQIVETVNSLSLPAGTSAAEAAGIIAAANRPQVAFRLRSVSTGAATEVRLEKSDKTRRQVYDRQVRWYSIVSHAADLSVAMLLIVVASLLKWFRRADPVSTLLSFALLFMATLGCWRLWDWLRIDDWLRLGPWRIDGVEAVLNGAWLGLLLAAVPALPNGRYRPDGSRWFLLLGPAVALLLAWNKDGAIDSLIMGTGGAVLLGAIALRYHHTPGGAERQQVKWAVLGVAAGVLLWLPGGSIEAYFWSDLPLVAKVFVFVSTRLGLAVLAVTLLFSLLGYRLHDADAVFSSSATSAAAILLLTALWAVGAHFASEAMREFEGVDNEPLAAAITAVAIAIFTPARTRLTQWIQNLLSGPRLRLRSLPDGIRRWRGDDEPAAIAQRALGDIVGCTGAGAGALLRDGAQGPPELLAAHEVTTAALQAYFAETPSIMRAEDPFPVRVEAADRSGQPIILLLGRRGNSGYYSQEERAALTAIMDPLADLLQAASRRAAYNRALAEALDDIRLQLRRLSEAH